MDKLAPIYKTINVNVEAKFYNTCIESKHIRIIQSKKITLIT